MNFKKTDGITILGKRGAGKTYLMAYLINQMNYKTIVIDPTGALTKYRFNNENVAVVMVDVQDEVKINKILEIAFKNGYMVAIDEIGEFPYEKYSSIRELVMRARNYGCGFIFASRSPADVHKSIITNSDYLMIFRFIEPNAVKYLKLYGVDVETVRKLGQYSFLVLKNGENQGVYRV